MSSLTLPPAGPPTLLIDPANQAAAQGGAPVVPGAAGRIWYLPHVALVLALCLVGLWINADSWRSIAALRASGVPLTGRVLDIDGWRLIGRYRLYFITFEYQVAGPDGRPQTYQSTDLTIRHRRDDNRFFLGQEVPVRYLPADPAVARFSDAEPPTIWLTLFVAASMFTLCLLLFFAKWVWDDSVLRRRGRVYPGTVVDVRPSLWPKTQQVAYRFSAPDGRELRGHADIDMRRLRQTGAPEPGTAVAVLYVDDGLHSML